MSAQLHRWQASTIMLRRHAAADHPTACPVMWQTPLPLPYFVIALMQHTPSLHQHPRSQLQARHQLQLYRNASVLFCPLWSGHCFTLITSGTRARAAKGLRDALLWLEYLGLVSAALGSVLPPHTLGHSDNLPLCCWLTDGTQTHMHVSAASINELLSLHLISNCITRPFFYLIDLKFNSNVKDQNSNININNERNTVSLHLHFRAVWSSQR